MKALLILTGFLSVMVSGLVSATSSGDIIYLAAAGSAAGLATILFGVAQE